MLTPGTRIAHYDVLAAIGAIATLGALPTLSPSIRRLASLDETPQ